MMQIWDALAWKSINNPSQRRLSAKGAYIFNVLQPIATGLFLLLVSPNSLYKKCLAIIVMLLYISWLLVKMPYDVDTELKPSANCSHLDYRWWREGGSSLNGKVYLISLITLICLLLPVKLAILMSSYILITLAISMRYYSCGAPSIWCWMVVVGGLTSLAV